MKQKDIILIVVVVIISGIVALFVSNILIAPPKSRQQKVEVVESVQANFTPPDKKYFNSDSIDPTQVIRIGGDTNPKPFTPKK